MYTCAECGKPIALIDGQKIRGCLHSEAPVILGLSVVMYGQSHVDQGHPEALKLMDTTPAQEP